MDQRVAGYEVEPEPGLALRHAHRRWPPIWP